jgi:hypothetical protein
MRPAGDEGDLRPRLLQRRAEHGPDTPGPDDRDAHRLSLLP